jgi:hypothetical protein
MNLMFGYFPAVPLNTRLPIVRVVSAPNSTTVSPITGAIGFTQHALSVEPP